MLWNDIRELNRTLHSIDRKLDVIVEVIKKEKKSEWMSIKEIMIKYFWKFYEKSEEERKKKIREESITENWDSKETQHIQESLNSSFPIF